MNTKHLRFLPIAAALLFGVFRAQAQMPGGVTTGYTWMAWLTPESYNSGTWTNLVSGAGAIGNFTGAETPPAKTDLGGYNFHPAVAFDKSTVASAPNQLFSQLQHGITSANGVTIIFVLQRKTLDNTDELIGFSNTDNYCALSYRTTGNNDLTFTWGNTTARMITNVPEGILTIDNSNTTTTTAAQEGIRFYHNGVKTVSTASTQWNGTTNVNNGLVALAGGRNGTSWYGYQGNLQEVILIKTANNGRIDPVDLQKIHSYLAIKYGITLSNTDYLNSIGVTVWSQSFNTGYNNVIFGIGRDDASLLNQVQSCSRQDSAFIIYKGALNQLNDNNSTAFTDKSFLMLGSNGQKGNTKYEYPADTPFGNGKIAEKINYHTGAVYKAQVMVSGASGSQTANLKLNSQTAEYAKYVLVSPNSTFPASATRIYPVIDQVAAGVEINSGEYLCIAGYQPMPGGIDLSGYALDLWIDGNHSTDTSWDNIIPANYSLQKFSNNAPVTRDSKFNFHRELYFGNSSDSKLNTSTNYSLQPGNSYYVFAVSDATGIGTTDAVLFTFDRSATNTSLRWGASNNNNNVISSYWTTSQRPANTVAGRTFLPAYFPQKYGIAAMNIVNANSSPLDMYLNGTKASYTLGTAANASGPASYNLPLLIGDASAAVSGSSYGFSGSMQEFILIRKPSSAALMPDIDIAKIQSYLAIKYGITLNNNVVTAGASPSPNPSAGTGSNYINSAGDTVWNQKVNADFNYNIFGIGRDDASGLYQKQSQSANYTPFTVFLGAALAPLNSQNNGTLEDKQFLMFGSNGGKPIAQLNDLDTVGYINGNLFSSLWFNIQSAVYKTQLTGEPSMTVSLQSPSNDFLYALVSSDSTFLPMNTFIYPVTEKSRIISQVLFDQTYKYLKFIGFSPGPGGVNPGLRLWLRADDDAATGIENLPLSDSKLSAYTDPVSDPNNVPAVSTWSDLVRGQTYSYAAGGGVSPQRIPVMTFFSPEMNYYPAVQFWGSGTDAYGSFLANTSGILPASGQAQQPAHTAIFIVNNDFGRANWVYTMAFGGATGTSINGPVYGVQKSGTGAVGRFRTSGTPTIGTVNLFTVGATSILDYIQQDNEIQFRFNGKQENRTFNWGLFDMRAPSQLGKGYTYSRTILGYMSEAIIFDRVLSGVELQQVESYLAFKYGVTLYPSNTPNNRFTYLLSDDTEVWKGDAPSGIFVDFYNNVSAILRDDATRLNNFQSHSTNAGSLLHLGVPGTTVDGKTLRFDGSNSKSLGQLENMEAIASGNNGVYGNTHIIDTTNTCGDFTDRFNRIWLIHKKTKDNRPVTLMVGAQNNAPLTIGSDATVKKDYYDHLTQAHDVSMIVAASPDSIAAGNYRAVVPMTYINGEQQCSYTFTDEVTYITFGWKVSNTGCPADSGVVFSGSKKYLWTSQWTTGTNKSSNAGITVANGDYDLGNNIHITQTSVAYPSGVRPGIGYPRGYNLPARGSLFLARRGGKPYQDVVVTINFNHPVIPSFAISGIDYHGGAYEQVEVYGECSGSIYYPVLSYASTMSKSFYKIENNVATAFRKTAASAGNKNGMMNVSFQGGVTSITIKYRTVGRSYTGFQQIYISPVTLRMVPPPPPINEDGLSFTKEVLESELTTCEPVQYAFHIQNVNCIPKTVIFKDSLPANMTWQAESIGMDAFSGGFNPTLQANDYGNTGWMQIDSLVVPGSTTLHLTATAVLDADAPSGNYSNNASIVYDRLEDDKLSEITFLSLDRQTLDSLTVFNAEWRQRVDSVTLIPSYSKNKYSANSRITVTYTINNPNADIEDMFLNISFSPEFTLVGNLQITPKGSVLPVILEPTPEDPTTLNIAGLPDGTAGFTLPTGETVITFAVKAPALDDLRYDVDNDGLPNKDVMDLEINYELWSESSDPCLTGALKGTSGFVSIPYSKGKAAIISNRHVTSGIVQ